MNSIVEPYIGQKLTPLLEAFFKENIESLRIKQPGCVYTQDMRFNRVNIHIDNNGIITRVSDG